MGVASQFYTPVCDNKVPSLVDSLFSWRCLAASTSSFLHAAINLRPPSVTVSTHTSAFKAVAFQSPAMPNVRMSLCTQSVHSFSFPPRPLRVMYRCCLNRRCGIALRTCPVSSRTGGWSSTFVSLSASSGCDVSLFRYLSQT